MSAETPILELQQLSKSFRSNWLYRSVQAVSNVSLSIERGEVFGFLGHNGAGKTTTLKCIMGLLHPTSGTILLSGKPLRSAQQRSQLAYLPELPYFYDELSVAETLGFFGGLFGYSRAELSEKIEYALNRVSLQAKRNEPVRRLSKGLQQRLGFAQVLLGDPQLIFLDEPFSGLDPIGRRDFREIIQELQHKGATIVLSSHVLSDVEQLCDRVSIMVKGTLRKVVAIQDLRQTAGGSFELEMQRDYFDQALRTQAQQQGLTWNEKTTAQASVVIGFTDYVLAQQWLAKCAGSGAVMSFSPVFRSLEDVFVETTTEGAGR